MSDSAPDTDYHPSHWAPYPDPPVVRIAELEQDPHCAFRRYRPAAPVLLRDDGTYIAIRAGDCERLSSDRRTRQLETDRLEAQGLTSGPVLELIGRRPSVPLSAPFACQIANTLRSRMRAVSHVMLDRIEGQGRMNLLDDYAALLSTRMVSEVMTLPREDFLSEEGARTQVLGIILDASDTIRGGMATLVSLLLQHREQWEAVRHDPRLIPAAVAESLRFEPPVASVSRITLETVKIGRYWIPARKILILSTLSALRDPASYDDPDYFNIHRTPAPRRHLVFGHGDHHHLGELLARAELEEGLAAVLERFPHLRLLGEPIRIKGHTGIRRVSPATVALT